MKFLTIFRIVFSGRILRGLVLHEQGELVHSGIGIDLITVHELLPSGGEGGIDLDPPPMKLGREGGIMLTLPPLD